MRLFSKKGGETATDLVCHMDVDTKNPGGGTWEHNGETYYFCGPGCNRAFQKEPEAYISGEKKIDM
ncbi:MAG: YHS domain-containing protein [Chloroflexi bacterium]|nr:YHS domain-containing protein [Chloroflexota bacterium]